MWGQVGVPKEMGFMLKNGVSAVWRAGKGHPDAGPPGVWTKRRGAGGD